jgi:hypothetical protein
MAEGKNKIIVYKDWLKNFEDLTDEELGKLMRHFFQYVNDLNPVLEDRILNIAWRPIESTLKRDLKAWESFVEKQKDNGSKGGRPPKVETQITQALIQEPKKPDSVSVNVSVNANESVSEIKQSPPDSENQFKFPVGKSQNKPTDWNELREFVKTKSQNVGLTPPMVEMLTKEIVDHYADFDRVWRRADQQPILNWQKQIGTQWLTDLKIQEFKNKYLKLHPQQQVASMPKTRNN